MADLTPTSPLGGYDQPTGGLRVGELTGLALVSLAIPLDGEAKAAKAVKSAFRLDLPAPGMSTASNTYRLIRTAPDQLLLAFDDDSPDPAPQIAKALKTTAYTTDQTGAWVTLELSGASVRPALERLCPLDLHPAAFRVDAAHRTVMEHLGVLIVRTGDNSFWLMSASSSAMSFLHAMECTIRYFS